MSEYKGNPGELVYQYSLKITQLVEYGCSSGQVFSGQSAPPPEGARFDVYFEGVITGPRIKGTVRGVDYLHIRADGRCQLDIKAEITTEDGKKIALRADGLGTPEPGSPIVQLRENATLTTHHPEYAWVNLIQVWAPGKVDLSKGEIQVTGYAA